MNTKILYGIVIAIVIIGGAWLLTSNKDDAPNTSSTDNDTMEASTVMEQEVNDTTMMEAGSDAGNTPDAMMENDDNVEAMMEGDDTAMMSAGSYEAYDPSKLALADKGKVVIFFKANWCPTCQAVDKDIKASLNDIPAGVTILEADYDQETALKQKYGVTTQHTFVQVNSDGTEITKWVGGNTLEAVLGKLK